MALRRRLPPLGRGAGSWSRARSALLGAHHSYALERRISALQAARDAPAAARAAERAWRTPRNPCATAGPCWMVGGARATEKVGGRSQVSSADASLFGRSRTRRRRVRLAARRLEYGFIAVTYLHSLLPIPHTLVRYCRHTDAPRANRAFRASHTEARARGALASAMRCFCPGDNIMPLFRPNSVS